MTKGFFGHTPLEILLQFRQSCCIWGCSRGMRCRVSRHQKNARRPFVIQSFHSKGDCTVNGYKKDRHDSIKVLAWHIGVYAFDTIRYGSTSRRVTYTVHRPTAEERTVPGLVRDSSPYRFSIAELITNTTITRRVTQDRLLDRCFVEFGSIIFNYVHPLTSSPSSVTSLSWVQAAA